MGPNVLYAMSHVTFLYFPCVPMPLFIRPWRNCLQFFFIKGYVGLLQLLKWSCHTLFFSHVEPYVAIQGMFTNGNKIIVGYARTLKVCWVMIKTASKGQ